MKLHRQEIVHLEMGLMNSLDILFVPFLKFMIQVSFPSPSVASLAAELWKRKEEKNLVGFWVFFSQVTRGRVLELLLKYTCLLMVQCKSHAMAEFQKSFDSLVSKAHSDQGIVFHLQWLYFYTHIFILFHMFFVLSPPHTCETLTLVRLLPYHSQAALSILRFK